jgi:hypothetical protein
MNSGTVEVLVDPPGSNPAPLSPADSPALDGSLLAYSDDQGIEVIDWQANNPVEHIDGNVSDPALDWPLIAYREVSGGRERLLLADYSHGGNPDVTSVASVPAADSLGRPSLRGGRLAWHRVKHRNSAIFVLDLRSGKRFRVAHSSVAMDTNPALTATRIVPPDEAVRAQRHADADARERDEDVPLDDRPDGAHRLCHEVDALPAPERAFARHVLADSARSL